MTPELPPLFEDLPETRGEPTQEYNVKNYVRLIHHLGKLVESSQGDVARFSDADREFRPHDVTYLKLLALMAYARTFVKYGKAATRFFYLDVLSASGLSNLEGSGDPIPGSSLCVPMSHLNFRKDPTTQGTKFDKVFCFDRSDDALAAIHWRRDALECKFGFPMSEYQMFPGEASEKLDEVLSEIEEIRSKERGEGKAGPLTLAFVDNLGMNIPMATISMLQQRVRGDLVIHIPSGAIWRNIEAHRKNQDQRQVLTDFFGGDAWKEIESADDVPSIYHREVERVTGAALQDSLPVKIRGGKHTFHLAIYARHTRGTKGREGWVATIRPLLEACNHVDYSSFPTIKSMAVGEQRQTRLEL